MAQEEEIQDDSERTWPALRDAERRLQRRLDHSSVIMVRFDPRTRRMDMVLPARVKNGKACGPMPNRQVIDGLYAAAKSKNTRQEEHYAALDSYHAQYREKRLAEHRRRAKKEKSDD
jgi:hypothetical protein